MNDEGAKIFADDSTDGAGHARITIPSFSGCGTVTVHLYVSAVSEGNKSAKIRTLDTNANGRVTAADTSGACDVDYSGSVNARDDSIIVAHADHWHRNALFGTLVRRTNYCENCSDGYTGTIGESQVFWSPDGQRLSFTAHVDSLGPDNKAACKVFIVRSDPKQGNSIRQFSFPDSFLHDYDPSWSGRGTDIALGRDDWRILRKGVPGANSDTLLHLVTASGSSLDHGDLTPAISPDGEWVAFGRKDQPTGRYNLWKINLYGDAASLQRLTTTTNVTDQYPEWSPDGNWIVFDRQIGNNAEHHAYKVKSNGDSLQAVYDAPSGSDAATPGFSSDGQIITVGIGTHGSTTQDVRTYTIDPLLSTKKPILNYSDATFAIHGPDPVLSPRISPDGTRLALRSKQIYAVRRNMNSPPTITSINTTAIDDTTSFLELLTLAGHDISLTVHASDPESDPITYNAFFLQSGMTWNASTRTLSWHVPGNGPYYVKFQVATPSGGTDALVLAIEGSALQSSALRAGAKPIGLKVIAGPNPSRGEFVVTTGLAGRGSAELTIFDLSGRRIATIQGIASSRLVWPGTMTRGGPAPNGIYLYRLRVAGIEERGRLVMMR